MKEWFKGVLSTLKGLGSALVESWGYALLFLLIIAAMIAVAVFAEKIINRKNGFKETSGYRINKLVIMAMLAAVAVILNVFDFPVWFAPGFYKLDFSELPIIIGAFALGPVAGVAIEAVKILLNLVINGTVTAFVGEIANFCMGCAYIIPAAIIYYSHKTKKNSRIGLIIATLTAVVVGALLNAYVLLPTYGRVFFKTDSLDLIIGMGADMNSAINGLASFILLAVVPFNLLKFSAVSIVTALIYKPISHLLKNNGARS